MAGNGAENISLTAGSHAAADGGPNRSSLPPTVASVGAHRPPPYAEDAEKGLLGSILRQPEEWLDRSIELITETAFYLPAHQTLYAAMVDMRNKGVPIDYITLTQTLTDRRELDAIGGARVVSDLYTFTPTAANAEHYLDIVREKSVLRQIIATCTECATMAYDPGEEANVVLDDVERRVLAISEARGRAAMPPMKDRVLKAIEDLEKLYERRGGITGLSTGFKELDRMTSGLHAGEMIIIAARPSMGKCLSADTEVLLADGSVATMEEIYRSQSAELLTLDDRLRLRPARPSAFLDDGQKPTFCVTTALGRELICTLTHPFLAWDGWTPLGELAPGDYIAAPRHLPFFGRESLGSARAILLGCLLGDGGLTDTTPEFTNANPILREDFRRALAEAFPDLRTRECDSHGTRTPTLCVASDGAARTDQRAEFAGRINHLLQQRGAARRAALATGIQPASITAWRRGRSVPEPARLEQFAAHFGVTATDLLPASAGAARKNAPNALTRWLRDLGLWKCGAAQKFIPAPVFRAPRAELALLLNRLFATDGWATVLATGQCQIGFASTSEKLARQVQHLLLRFGICASRRVKRVTWRGTIRRAWQLNITAASSLRAFLSEIGILGKDAAVERVRQALPAHAARGAADVIPSAVWKRVEALKSARGWSWLELGRRAGLPAGLRPRSGGISRTRLGRIARALESEELLALAESDVLWDRIASVEFLGRRQVYDLTVPGTHNFIAGNLCVHNTALAVNIAEHVAIEGKAPVVVFSLEMSAQSLVATTPLFPGARKLSKLRDGFLGERDFPALTQAASKLAESTFIIDDTAGLSVLELRARARRYKNIHGIQLIVIDYLQLLKSTSRRAQDNRQLEIAEISSGVKALAKELELPIIVLAQLNRQPEARTGGKPRLSDLRESGSARARCRSRRPARALGILRGGRERQGGQGRRGRAHHRQAAQWPHRRGEAHLPQGIHPLRRPRPRGRWRRRRLSVSGGPD